MECSRIVVALASGMVLGLSTGAAARDMFNPALLEIDHPVDVDIHQFNRANNLPAGNYKVDIHVNGEVVGRRDVMFVEESATGGLHPCFTDVKSMLAGLGVKVAAIKALNDVDDKTCLDPAPLVPGSTWTFDTDKLQLNVTLPQIYIDTSARGYISPDRWDEGINALMVNYDFSGSSTVQSDEGNNDDFYYLNLRNGINLGAWRLRNYSTLNVTDGQSAYHSINTYAQRDIAALRSQIMLGDTWTASDVFDSTQLRGVRLYTDDDMLPSSQTGFAPVVRGVAKSNATVIVRQNGYIIYQSAVPQGAFALKDLNTTSSGGDLDVTIKEEDGSEQHFTQPYASLAILKREDQTDVDLSVGELRDQNDFQPTVFQAQVLRGFPAGVTLYGGVQVASDYASAALGVGKDMGLLGAISLDVTQARAQFEEGDDESGQSYRFLYSKRFDETNTTFRLVGYRYSTQGYYTLNEWASRQNNDSDFWTTGNRRSRLEGTWTQTFGEGMGNIYLTLSRQQYWKTDDVERLVQLGYSNSWRSISWNVSWNYTNSLTSVQSASDSNASSQQSEQIFMLSLSVPLSGWLHNSYVNYGFTQNNHGKGMHQVGLSGTALDAHNLSWNAQQSYDADADDYNSSVGMGYDGTYGSVNASYDMSRDNQRLNYGVKGGILAHSDGITFSQEMGETVALVKAPGASGLALENGTGKATDWRGYTVQTQLNAYDENRVEIDSDYFAKANVEIDNSILSVIPTRGAVVRAEFVTHVGYRVLFSVRQKNGKPVPFGAMATSDLPTGSVTGITGENGELYLSGMPEEGAFVLKWGAENSVTCPVHYHFTRPEGVELVQISAVCQ
ncbi:fimbria/pilus outer membrane usher protein [Enterobacter hormaechei]|uniref:fimbria/pilus outer membrane usher protein n=1 Tax=Enterobacter hormaechei TaxID=158836 RepID=UPI00298B908B|nr:fimbrial biogenesis outer membrane usher protein [Enterobacter hormaechei]HBL5174782.1 fimbrial biogenesis outer membrane usher protein [Enterobacter hormaechei]HBL6014419.1 fimbrial biogenesis outer membrane usher protein [Enterobacter hormaechei]HBL6128040.1 fimbrial biogenesis outer membrane usher protein [Enterobacter hormaechei]HBL8994502.1 fimbrial biogenesis outer membrane usher protein [Enterobacter hormaechei]